MAGHSNAESSQWQWLGELPASDAIFCSNGGTNLTKKIPKMKNKAGRIHFGGKTKILCPKIGVQLKKILGSKEIRLSGQENMFFSTKVSTFWRI